MYLLVMGFITARLEDDSGWSSADASFAFSVMGCAMIFGGPLFTAVAQRLTVRITLVFGFGLWPLLVAIVLSGVPAITLPACVGLGMLFAALPTLPLSQRRRCGAAAPPPNKKMGLPRRIKFFCKTRRVS